jgi:hypothetical protein
MPDRYASWNALATAARRSRDYQTSWFWYYHAVRTFRQAEEARTGRRPGYMEARRDPLFREAWQVVGRGRVNTTRRIERAARRGDTAAVEREWLRFRENPRAQAAFRILGQRVPRGEQYLQGLP